MKIGLSIRARVTITMALLVFASLLGMGFALDYLYSQSERAMLEEQVDSQIEAGRALSHSGVEPERIADLISTSKIHAAVVMPGGHVYGEMFTDRNAVVTRNADLVLTAGIRPAQLVVWTEAPRASFLRCVRCRAILVITLRATGIAALISAIVSGVALRPLKRMADAAEQVARGERGVRLNPVRTTTEIGRTALAIDHMLSEMEGAERRARAAESQAKSAEQQMKEFLADAAHELKTPLAGVQAAAESLQVVPEGAPERRELERLLVREAQRGGDLVARLLETVRVEAGGDLEMTDVDLNQLAQRELRRLQAAYPDRTIRLRSEPVIVRADVNAVESILRNLTSNAARETEPPESTLNERIRPWIDIEVRPEDDGALIRVTNSGEPINEADRERIFGRFVRLPSAAADQSGSGLGLAIARGYAKAHQGTLVVADADSEARPFPEAPGAGSCFELWLPDKGS